MPYSDPEKQKEAKAKWARENYERKKDDDNELKKIISAYSGQITGLSDQTSTRSGQIIKIISTLEAEKEALTKLVEATPEILKNTRESLEEKKK